MKFTYVKFALSVLMIGLFSACGAQPAASTEPASQPTEIILPTAAPPTQAPPSTDTAAPTAPDVATDPAAATQPSASGATVSFANDVLPIFQSRCVNCHGGNEIEEGLLLRSHAEVMAGSDNGPVIVPGDAANSLLVELVATMEMPKRGPKLTPPQIQIITDWVNEGALDN